ncbi:MAG: TVP38/TMEM64 family protein [Clostridia bacterium]|nr:TVP38/TMEM64 family protein [Clostridia bacterium]
MNKTKSFLISVLKLILITLLGCGFFVGIYFILKHTGWIGKFNNIHELKTLILSAGFWSYTVFVVLQFLQVTILPLPAFATTIVGVILFGPFIAFLLSTLSIILGSIFAFFLGKTFGIKLLYWAIGKEKTLAMQSKLEQGKYIFFLMMLFPFFPDDILCMLAGVINMDFKFFLITNFITRPISLFCLCFVSTGIIIPFHSWGIVVWILLAIILISIFVFSIKYKSQIENFFTFKLKTNKKN